MFCPECGKPLPDAAVRTCPCCGTTFEVPEQPTPTAPESERKTCKRSAAALLLGSASVVWYLPALLGVSVLTGLLIGGLAAAVLHALAKVKPAS